MQDKKNILRILKGSSEKRQKSKGSTCEHYQQISCHQKECGPSGSLSHHIQEEILKLLLKKEGWVCKVKHKIQIYVSAM